jgi:hypothetical protein
MPSEKITSPLKHKIEEQPKAKRSLLTQGVKFLKSAKLYFFALLFAATLCSLDVYFNLTAVISQNFS